MPLDCRHIALSHGREQYRFLVDLRNLALRYASHEAIQIYSSGIYLPPQDLRELMDLSQPANEDDSSSDSVSSASSDKPNTNYTDDTTHHGSGQAQSNSNAIPWLQIREVSYQPSHPQPTNTSSMQGDGNNDNTVKDAESGDEDSTVATSDAGNNPDYRHWVEENSSNSATGDGENHQPEAFTSNANNCLDSRDLTFDNPNGNYGVPIDPRLAGDRIVLDAPDANPNESSATSVDAATIIQNWLLNGLGLIIRTEELHRDASNQNTGVVLSNSDQNSSVSLIDTSQSELINTLGNHHGVADGAASVDTTNGVTMSQLVNDSPTADQDRSEDKEDTRDARIDDSSTLGSSEFGSDNEPLSSLMLPRKDYWPEKFKRELDEAEAKYIDYQHRRIAFQNEIMIKVLRTGQNLDHEIRDFFVRNMVHRPIVNGKQLLELKRCIDDVVHFNYHVRTNMNTIYSDSRRRSFLRYEPRGSPNRFRSKCLGSSLRYVIGIDQDWGEEDNWGMPPPKKRRQRI
ncbi:hypothetical protein ACHAPU_001352 [Fusarium lateritium]